MKSDTSGSPPKSTTLPVINEAVRFKLTRKMAEGGMGAVYQAQQYGTEGFEKTVAIKTMLSKLTDTRYADMFVAEAKLVANLVHENIVQIYQLGRNEQGYYIVMEYVNGISLEGFISYHRQLKIRIPEELAVFIVSRICRGLAYAHKRHDADGITLGIVHRDVCPNNILITTEGLPKLADFGVAKVATDDLLGDRWLVGKLLYMAPEQAHRKSVDFKADIFSLGAILFELLSFHTIRSVDLALVKKPEELATQEIPWHLLSTDIPDELTAICKRMLALRSDDRYQDTDELAHDLEYFIYRHGYGPTIQTLERYLRKHFDYLYKVHHSSEGSNDIDNTTISRTVVFNQ